MNSIEIQVKGIVQGVGFRPFVYNLAIKNRLFGWVNNDDRGVNIALEGDSKAIENFINTLKNSPPPLASIDSINIVEKNLENFSSFDIKKSEITSSKSTIISPDMAVCQYCIDDINDKSNFRFSYALTNCTNCGPRYSIIKTVPYDRINTSMAQFKMCNKCEDEYKNPLNRRYHAQPVSCEVCGPKIALYNNKNKELSKDLNAIKEIAKKIKEGEIVAIKGLGGFHLVCDATNDKSVKTLRDRKNRPSKPFAVMFKNIEAIKDYTNITLKEEELINSKQKPITLVKFDYKRNNKLDKQNKLSEHLAVNIDRLGCFIAYTPLHHLLFRYLDIPIIATSANLSGDPILRFKDEIIEKLGNIVDYTLDFNRDIVNACDDSVVQIVNNDISILRNARGFAPSSFKLDTKSSKRILALGANQKSTITLAFEDNLILSPYIGNLGSITSIEYFTRTIETFKRFYDFEADIIVCDKHPSYESTKWAKTQNIKLVQIQHHYAHVLSCMAEYSLDKDVLAFCFDGTGYGDDGNIWGGEVFLANKKDYERVNHIKYFKLLGGEKSIKEPKRVALSLLFDIYSLDEILKLDNACIKAFKENEIRLMHTMWQKGLNSPLTSSVGRLFDAIASLSSLAQVQSYEGETGLQIEMAYNENIKEYYPFEIKDKQIDIKSAIKEIIEDKNSELISSKFLNMLVEIVVEISKKYDSLPIILTGGVFQNKTLLELVCKRLESMNKEFYYSKKIPLNDSGISIGQAYSLIN